MEQTWINCRALADGRTRRGSRPTDWGGMGGSTVRFLTISGPFGDRPTRSSTLTGREATRQGGHCGHLGQSSRGAWTSKAESPSASSQSSTYCVGLPNYGNFGRKMAIWTHHREEALGLSALEVQAPLDDWPRWPSSNSTGLDGKASNLTEGRAPRLDLPRTASNRDACAHRPKPGNRPRSVP